MADASTTGNRSVGAVSALVLLALVTVELGWSFTHVPASAEAAHALGELAGRITVWTLGAAFVASIAWNRARLFYWLAMVVGVGMQLALLVPMVEHATRAPPPVLTDAERAPPVAEVRDGVRWARHDGLGFELPLPDDLVLGAPPPEMEEALAAHPELRQSMVAWLWQSADARRVVIVTATVLGHYDAATAASSFADVCRGARSSIQVPGIRLLDDEGSSLDRIMHFAGANGAAGTQRLLAYESRGRLVSTSVSAVSVDAPSLEASATGLRVRR